MILSILRNLFRDDFYLLYSSEIWFFVGRRLSRASRMIILNARATYKAIMRKNKQTYPIPIRNTRKAATLKILVTPLIVAL